MPAASWNQPWIWVFAPPERPTRNTAAVSPGLVFGIEAGLDFFNGEGSTTALTVADDYEFRSSMCSALCLNWWVSGDKPAENIPDDFPFDWANQTLEQYLQYRQYYYGDYYPLTSYSQSSDLWMAYQLDRPDLGEGLVVVLKRPQSPYQSVRLILKALDRDAEYRLFYLDRKKEIQHRGSELLDRGLELELVVGHIQATLP